MGAEDGTDRWEQLVEAARANLVMLDHSGPLRAVVSVDWLVELGESLVGGHPLERVPPLFLMLAKLDIVALRAFESDLRSVGEASTQSARVGVFLRDGLSTALASERQWLAGMAENALCSALLERFPGRARVEPQLPNGKRCDAVLALSDGTRVWLECTVLSISDAEYSEIDPYADVQVWSGDPYVDARRLYRKIYDKIIGTRESMKAQIHPDEPSVVVVVEGSVMTPGLTSLGTDWALGQLLDPAKRVDTSRASLVAWIEHDYRDVIEQALTATDKLTAICLASYRSGATRLETNRSPTSTHRLTDAQLAELAIALQDIHRPWS